jgi:hypothetical protein
MAALEKLKIDDPGAIEKCTVAMGLSLGMCVYHMYRRRMQYSVVSIWCIIVSIIVIHVTNTY